MKQFHALNDRGLGAYSREVALDPPRDAYSTADDGQGAAMLATGVAGLGAVMLLAGAGFVVTFRSQQRERALGCRNRRNPRHPCDSRSLARVWLGLAGGAGGVCVGVALGLGWVTTLLRLSPHDGSTPIWGYHVTWWHACRGRGTGHLLALSPRWFPRLRRHALTPLPFFAVASGRRAPVVGPP